MSGYFASHTFLQAEGVRLSFEQFGERVWVQASFLDPGEHLLDDRVLAILRHAMVLRTNGGDPGLEALEHACRHLAYSNQRNAVLDYFKGLKHDGQKYVGAWLLNALGAKNTALNRNTIRRFLVAGVKRVYEPGCRSNFIPIFEGPQTAGKSPFMRILAREPAFFTDAPILRLNSQRRQEALRGKHIVEIAEMEGWKSTSVEHLKAITSATHDYGRRPWDRCSTDQPRMCVFAGTTNDRAPLRDVTGNFRFPIIRVGKRIDLDLIEANIDQIWAHARELYSAGFSLELPDDLRATLQNKQQSQMEDEPWADQLATLPAECIVSGEERVSYDAVFARLGLSVGRTSAADTKRASEAMQRLGWNAPAPRYLNGKTVRCFFRRAKEKE